MVACTQKGFSHGRFLVKFRHTMVISHDLFFVQFCHMITRNMDFLNIFYRHLRGFKKHSVLFAIAVFFFQCLVLFQRSFLRLLSSNLIHPKIIRTPVLLHFPKSFRFTIAFQNARIKVWRSRNVVAGWMDPPSGKQDRGVRMDWGALVYACYGRNAEQLLASTSAQVVASVACHSRNILCATSEVWFIVYIHIRVGPVGIPMQIIVLFSSGSEYGVR